MKENNKKYFYIKKLRDLLESKGWKVSEAEFPYSGTIYIGTVLMKWELQRSTKVKLIKVEFIAAQIAYYTTADPNDFDCINFSEFDTDFYFNKKEWEATVNEICHYLDSIEHKLKTEHLSERH